MKFVVREQVRLCCRAVVCQLTRVQLGIPIIVGVPYRNLDQWRLFAGGLAEECETTSPRLSQWLLQHGLGPGGKALRPMSGPEHGAGCLILRDAATSGGCSG
ncbi:DUF2478 domain-containing protein [Rhodopseudomonas rhenobacensis]|uniref:DUF2478 domain-containing protein n=1 Tax=Rhodopseudomonas rhenobacensis TaxID=87461 RepID=UPI001612602A